MKTIDDVIAAFTTAQSFICNEIGNGYSAEGKEEVRIMIDHLVKPLKWHQPHQFWSMYAVYGAESPDAFDEVMNHVFATLEIEMVDELEVILK